MSLSTLSSTAGVLTAILVVAPLLDKLGKRFVAIHLRFVALIFGSVLILLAALLPSFECFVVSFFFTTVSFEIKFFATTLFIVECTPYNIRGLSLVPPPTKCLPGYVTILQSLADVCGAVLATTLTRPSIFGTEDKWWQMGAISLLLNLLSASYLIWLPESPKRLVVIGKRTEARKSQLFYHGRHESIESLLDSYEREATISSSTATMSWKEAWRNRTIRKSIYLILAFYMAINLSPYSTEMMFSVLIQMIMGLSTEMALTLNSIVRLLAIPLSFPVSFAIEKLGRRAFVFATLFILFTKSLIMFIGMCVAFFAGPCPVTVAIAVANDLLSSMVSSMGIVLIASLCELTPLNARVAVSQICNLVPAVSMIPYMTLLPLSLTTFSPIIYIIPLIALPPLSVYIYRNLPETKGRRVCDIIEDFDYCVRSRAPTRQSMLSVDEHTPLVKRGSLLQK